MDVKLSGVDHQVGHAPDGGEATAFLGNSLPHGEVAAHGVGAASFAEATHQRVVAGLDKNQRYGKFVAQLAVDFRELGQLFAFASIHQERSAIDFAAALEVEFGKSGNEANRQIVDAVETQVFESF